MNANKKILIVRAGLFVVLVACIMLLAKELVSDDGRVAGIRIGRSANSVGKYTINAPKEASISGPIKVDLTVDTKDKAVNAVALYLKFPTNRMRALSMDTSNSFCEFFPENKFDNNTGLIKLACGLPTPGFTGVGSVATLTFEPLSTGSAKLQILPRSAILLNDGKATNILSAYPVHEVLILGNL